jgi:tRNA-Thr(GGU) m(6)t(6)A37 methyltransferase TsaA
MIALEPIGHVQNIRQTTADDYWGAAVSAIVLADHLDPDCLLGLDSFSHAEIIYYFHQVPEDKIVTGARHPRNNPDWPKIGIFAQRAKNRPNRLGLTTVSIKKREGRRLYVEDLDAIDGTPVVDIKPVMTEFLPRGAIRQPDWSHALMQAYWLPNDQRPRE